MLSALIIIFVITYAAITLEHSIKINKSATALLGAGLLWTIYAVATSDHLLVSHQLSESIASTAEIVFFLIGAMTIVEVIDAHNGFEVITSRIKTKKLSYLLWIVGFLSFFLSAVLDNLTATIVMISLTRKLLQKKEDRLLFAAMVVISANAGGAWSPIGDVTTTMLWIGGQITTLAIIKGLFLASLVNLIAPLLFVSHSMKGKLISTQTKTYNTSSMLTSNFERNTMFYFGLGILVLVPVFKTVTHLPPFMGILFGLGLLWLVGDLIHYKKEDADKQQFTLAHALHRIDMTSIVFFIGILLAVATLEHSHILNSFAAFLDHAIGRQDYIVTLLGLMSAVVDNVPLVAASMGMYDLTQYPADSFLWEFMAYCAGTGGSILIIGSAAGVAAMGLEKIPFFWYVKKISWLALIGYFAGIATYIVQYNLTH
jgi:Na+/H+ antiporter NhaD/arsenite permease-like protein